MTSTRPHYRAPAQDRQGAAPASAPGATSFPYDAHVTGPEVPLPGLPTVHPASAAPYRTHTDRTHTNSTGASAAAPLERDTKHVTQRPRNTGRQPNAQQETQDRKEGETTVKLPTDERPNDRASLIRATGTGGRTPAHARGATRGRRLPIVAAVAALTFLAVVLGGVTAYVLPRDRDGPGSDRVVTSASASEKPMATTPDLPAAGAQSLQLQAGSLKFAAPTGTEVRVLDGGAEIPDGVESVLLERAAPGLLIHINSAPAQSDEHQQFWDGLAETVRSDPQLTPGALPGVTRSEKYRGYIELASDQSSTLWTVWHGQERRIFVGCQTRHNPSTQALSACAQVVNTMHEVADAAG